MKKLVVILGGFLIFSLAGNIFLASKARIFDGISEVGSVCGKNMIDKINEGGADFSGLKSDILSKNYKSDANCGALLYEIGYIEAENDLMISGRDILVDLSGKGYNPSIEFSAVRGKSLMDFQINNLNNGENGRG